jgi:hypothetical protein
MASASPSDRDRLAAARGAVWEVGLIAMPTAMVQEDGRTVQPLIALVVEAAGPIRSVAVGPSDQPLEVLVSQAELLELLPSLLPGVLIQRDATPQLNVVSQQMLMRFGGEESEEGDEDRSGTEALATYLTEDLGPDEVARFFAAALVAWIEADPRLAKLWQQPSPKRRRFPVVVAGKRVSVTIGVVPRDSGRH